MYPSEEEGSPICLTPSTGLEDFEASFVELLVGVGFPVLFIERVEWVEPVDLAGSESPGSFSMFSMFISGTVGDGRLMEVSALLLSMLLLGRPRFGAEVWVCEQKDWIYKLKSSASV